MSSLIWKKTHVGWQKFNLWILYKSQNSRLGSFYAFFPPFFFLMAIWILFGLPIILTTNIFFSALPEYDAGLHWLLTCFLLLPVYVASVPIYRWITSFHTLLAWHGGIKPELVEARIFEVQNKLEKATDKINILICKSGQIGHITLNRPKALNALTYQMCLDIEAALDEWATDDSVKMVLIDAAGEKAFCSGGDIQQMYDTAKAGDFDYGRRFWADEYRMNAKLANFPKPFVALMQGFTMGGGVGVSCHGSHRVVCETSQIAMPECGIGLVPDVGGSFLLAQAPGCLGEYLGTTASRMDAGDAIYAGFADYYIPFKDWPALTDRLINSGDWEEVDKASHPAPASKLQENQPLIDTHFSAVDMRSFCNNLDGSEWCNAVEKSLRRNSPLSVSCTLELVRRVRAFRRIEDALNMEYRFTYRSASDGDFVEGIRAAIIDKDRNPQWKHDRLEDVNLMEISRMLLPLGANALKL